VKDEKYLVEISTKLPYRKCIELCNKYKKGLGAYTLAVMYGISPSHVYQILKRNNIKTRSNSEANHLRCKYICNEEYFSNIDTEDKAYWLGFIYGDGHITNKKLVINLNYGDVSHLYQFKFNVCSTHPVLPYVSINGDYQSFEHSLEINRMNLVSNLRKKKVPIGNKHAIIKFPYEHVPRRLWWHFIRGLVDADGGISYTYYPKEKRYRYSFYLESSQEMLKSIRNLFAKYLSLPENKIESIKGTFLLRYCSFEAIAKIYRILYKNATVFLERKRNRFEEIIMLFNHDPRDILDREFAVQCLLPIY